LLNEIMLDAGGVLLWNGGPCCPQQTENREGRYFRVIGQEAKMVTDLASADEQRPLWISIMVKKIDTIH
jgi:hypothetical protein